MSVPIFNNFYPYNFFIKTDIKQLVKFGLKKIKKKIKVYMMVSD